MGLEFLRGCDVGADLIRKKARIAPGRGSIRFLLAPELAEEPAARLRLFVGPGRRQQWNRVRLNVSRPVERAQIREELFFVARRQERGDEDDVRDARHQRGYGGIA